MVGGMRFWTPFKIVWRASWRAPGIWWMSLFKALTLFNRFNSERTVEMDVPCGRRWEMLESKLAFWPKAANVFRPVATKRRDQYRIHSTNSFTIPCELLFTASKSCWMTTWPAWPAPPRRVVNVWLSTTGIWWMSLVNWLTLFNKFKIERTVEIDVPCGNRWLMLDKTLVFWPSAPNKLRLVCAETRGIEKRDCSPSSHPLLFEPTRLSNWLMRIWPAWPVPLTSADNVWLSTTGIWWMSLVNWLTLFNKFKIERTVEIDVPCGNRWLMLDNRLAPWPSEPNKSRPVAGKKKRSIVSELNNGRMIVSYVVDWHFEKRPTIGRWRFDRLDQYHWRAPTTFGWSPREFDEARVARRIQSHISLTKSNSHHSWVVEHCSTSS
jgi:hypothetical protein